MAAAFALAFAVARAALLELVAGLFFVFMATRGFVLATFIVFIAFVAIFALMVFIAFFPFIALLAFIAPAAFRVERFARLDAAADLAFAMCCCCCRKRSSLSSLKVLAFVGLRPGSPSRRRQVFMHSGVNSRSVRGSDRSGVPASDWKPAGDVSGVKEMVGESGDCGLPGLVTLVGEVPLTLAIANRTRGQ